MYELGDVDNNVPINAASALLSLRQRCRPQAIIIEGLFALPREGLVFIFFVVLMVKKEGV